jgi:DNA-directed RNA polymerase subunit RPC12/RpoP
MPFLKRRRTEPEPPAEADAPPAPPAQRRPLPPPTRLRRERRTLLRVREERIRDLGGLVLEMYRRQGFRQDLVDEQCAELVSLEDRLRELDALLAAAVGRRAAPTARCECGAPILWGSHFCAHCGRPLGERPVVACPSCGAAVPAGARFCAACGHAIESEQAREAPAVTAGAADAEP